MSTTEAKRFVSPYDDPAPEGAEGWEELYPYYLHFREDRREFEEGRFWFADLQHWPTVFKPFDTITVEFAIKCLGQYNTRHLLIPPANGIDYRVHNGYVYMSPVPVPEAEIPARVPHFASAPGTTSRTGRRCWRTGRRRSAASSTTSRRSSSSRCPTWWTSSGSRRAAAWTTRSRFAHNYDRAIELCYEAFQYHFEFLNLGYVAYLDFFTFCKEVLPGVADLGIAKMVQGIDVVLFRPDEELRKLARLAVEFGRGRRSGLGRGERRQAPAVLAAVAAAPGGRASGSPPGRRRRIRGSTSPRATACTRSDRVWRDHLGDPAGVHPRLRRPAAGRGGDRAPDRADPRRARPDHRRIPRSCCPTTRRAPCSTASSAWPGSSFPTSRTTTSTSSTGRCRCSGARSASSDRSSPTPASGTRPTTSSTCAATSSSR